MRWSSEAANVIEQGQTICCYAKSEKSWIDDPAGISWEMFRTMGESIDYGDPSSEGESDASAQACCAPQAAPAGCGCRAE